MNIPKGFPPQMFIDDDGSFNQELFDAISGNPCKTPREDITEELSFACFSPRIAPQDYLTIAQLNQEDINGRNIVDIGGGAGCFALMIQNTMKPNQLEIIDPIFKDHTFNFVVKDSIKKLSNLIKTDDMLKISQEKIDEIKQKKEESKKVLEQYLRGTYRGVTINPGYGNKTGLTSESQDIVFINHLLHKLDDDEIIMTIKEALRILKKGGKIYIIDYPGQGTTKIIQALNNASDTLQHQIPRNNTIFNQNKDSTCIKIKKHT